MRLLDRLFRRNRDEPERDRRLEAALIAARLKEQKRSVRDQRAGEDYSSRGSGYIGR